MNADAPLELYDLGFSVLPVCADGSKKPLLKSWAILQKEPAPRFIIECWFTHRWPNAGIGIVTGAVSGVDVLDIDMGADPSWPGPDKPLPAGLIVRTPSGGCHRYFRHVPGYRGKANALASGVDTRTSGNYAICPPTPGYEVIHGDFATARETEAPAWLKAALLDGQKAPGALPAEGAPIPRGRRNDTLTRVAGSLRRQGVGEGEILASLQAVNRRCQPPLPQAELRAIAKSVGKYPSGIDPNFFPFTDTGNAELLATLHGDRLRFDHRRQRWLLWAEDWWTQDADNAVTRLAIDAARLRHHAAVNIQDSAVRDDATKWAHRSESATYVANTLRMASALRPIADSGAGWDSDPFLLGVLNGIVDLKTGQLRGGRPEDKITKVAPVEFDAKATCPLWLRFLDEIMEGNAGMIAFLQRLAGYCFTADVREQVLPIFWGVGRNGKNTFLESLMGLLGPYAAEAPPSLLVLRRTEEHATEFADLFGKRLVVASETGSGARLRLALIKKLTGDRYIKGRFMRCDFFQFERTHKTVLMTNHRPVVRENTLAAWRRLKLIPFRVVISEEDKLLGEKLKAEWPGVLNWALAGCVQWLHDGLGEPPEVANATAAYRVEQDTLADFWQTRCRLAADAWTSRADLFKAYVAWSDGNHEKPMPRPAFFEETRQLPNVTEEQRRWGGPPARGFAGIGVIP